MSNSPGIHPSTWNKELLTSELKWSLWGLGQSHISESLARDHLAAVSPFHVSRDKHISKKMYRYGMTSQWWILRKRVESSQVLETLIICLLIEFSLWELKLCVLIFFKLLDIGPRSWGILGICSPLSYTFSQGSQSGNWGKPTSFLEPCVPLQSCMEVKPQRIPERQTQCL
jgi:hypothetical protein